MNKKKVIKTILIILLSLIIIFVAAAVAVFQFVIKPNTKVITDAVEQIITDEEFIEEFEIETLPEDLTEELTEDLLEEIPKDLVPEKEETEDKKEPPKPVKPKEEYKNTYDYIKDNVDSSDLKKGISYASRIDVAYILGLLKGGLTIPEKRELKVYLKERFSNSEINDGISLYNKYSYLLK